MKHKLVLIAPFVCHQSIGEGESAFQIVDRLAQRHDVSLLTYSLRADPPALQQGLAAQVIEWRDLPIVGKFPRLNSQLTPGYITFFLHARRWLRRHLAKSKVDLVHQLAPLALRYPCPAVGLGVPYIVGPLGGSLEAPPPLKASIEREPFYRRLRALDRLRFRIDPLLRATYEHAATVIAVAPYVCDLLSSLKLPPVRFQSEAGVERVLERPARTPGPARLLFVGRIIRTKGVRDLIRSLMHVEDSEAQLDVVGGEDLDPCKKEAATSGVASRVRFHGQVARSSVEAFYRRADIFVFPSFREPSGKAILEAMSHGLPVIATNYGGPAAVVDPTCGRLIEPAPPDAYARNIALQINALLGQPSLLETLGQGAQRRVEDTYTWDRKVDWLCNLYRELI